MGGTTGSGSDDTASGCHHIHSAVVTHTHTHSTTPRRREPPSCTCWQPGEHLACPVHTLSVFLVPLVCSSVIGDDAGGDDNGGAPRTAAPTSDSGIPAVCRTTTRQPGLDGSRLRRRFEKRVVRAAPPPCPEQHPRAHLLWRTMLTDIVKTKAKFPACSGSMVDDMLRNAKRLASNKFNGSDVLQMAAASIPDTHQELMNQLETAGIVNWPVDHLYDGCSRCGLLYRLEHKNSEACPHCKRDRRDRKHPAKPTILRSLAQYALLHYASPTAAKLLKTWPERSERDGVDSIVDVQGSRQWQEQVHDDPNLRDKTGKLDPRHLIVSIYVDGFQVGG